MVPQHERETDKRIMRLAARFGAMLPMAGTGDDGAKLSTALAALVADAIAQAERRVRQRLFAEAAARRRLIDRLQRS